MSRLFLAAAGLLATAVGAHTLPSGLDAALAAPPTSHVAGVTEPAPELAFSPGAVTFGRVLLGTTATQTVTVTNTGTSLATISQLYFRGDPEVVLDLAGTDLTLAAGQSTTFGVAYTPTPERPTHGTVRVVSDAPGSPAILGVSGSPDDGTTPSVLTLCSGVRIQIPDSGPGNPYPGALTVSGVTTAVLDVDVRLVGLSHTYPGDVEVRLVHPVGMESYVLYYDGGSGEIYDIDLTLDDEADEPLPEDLVSGTYLPNGPPGEASFALFDGADPNGAWRLYVYDGAGSDQGSLDDWCLDLTLAAPVAAEAPAGARDLLTVAPNPAAIGTTVRLAVAESQPVTVALYDVTGRRVAVLHDGPVAAGPMLALPVDAASLPAGVYVVRATGAGVDLTQRLTVVR